MKRFYAAEIEMAMKQVYDSFSEKDRRIYAAIESKKLPYGGMSYISNILDCDINMISRGLKELTHFSYVPKNRIRREGGGRKKVIDQLNGIDSAFLKVLKNHTAGDPMNEKLIWTDLNANEISELLKQEGIDVGISVVEQLLDKHGYSRRKALKMESIGSSENRNEQFENIAGLKDEYQNTGNPVISIDAKKKEKLGNLYRSGTLYTKESIKVFDHDFESLSEGNVILYGIFDLWENSGFVNIGTSKDTSEFVCDSIRIWWENYGQYDYPGATSILALADGGGSNSSRHYIFKEDLQKLVDQIGIEIRMAHYPPYTSKWNPIEHRLFPHVTKAMSGSIFKTHEFVEKLIQKTRTKTGLTVKTQVTKKEYQTGRKVQEGFKEKMKIVFDDFLPKWNYKAIPLLT